jgi:general L-amino acid transport system permease protein
MLSQRGLYLPWAIPTETFSTWLMYLGVALVFAVVVYFVRRAQLKRADRPGFPGVWALLTFLVFGLITWFLQSNPLHLDFPYLPIRPNGRPAFNIVGGLSLTTEFSALLIGLVIYTASFIAEIVRAGIQSVTKGQKEAARALGLRSGKVLQLVVLPQALRVIVPPMTSQYLNLTKNSSLAIAIGYFDVTRVANTTINQSGHGVEGIAALMSAYLLLSLIISAIMNQVNKRIKLVER